MWGAEAAAFQLITGGNCDVLLQLACRNCGLSPTPIREESVQVPFQCSVQQGQTMVIAMFAGQRFQKRSNAAASPGGVAGANGGAGLSEV